MTPAVVRIVDDALTPLELDDAVQDLIEDLRESGVDGERPVAGPAPDGTRAAELVEVGLVVVQGIVESGLVRVLADRVRTWFGRSGVNEVEVTIGEHRLALTNATAEQQDELVRHFIDRTGGGR
ncbi:hypothetical protein ABZ816_00745 [Actinosynnema sp. NPDC047251]|uniref:Uncharacterized protein n=1 Tax=Saccharothrix espanaensis (strain ATCC 51144 / DSM 44229 / JCM 9112 / NBRC 15066 / NRRL 15764) TaxID=1179773 RepID=K0JSS0_SACES|nr:hypothetical protein [Saccharothrix espanaensis]CCH30775.1 hypothetical protein BN6_34770 [Saccharothrix espanaensis DSM 44229]